MELDVMVFFSSHDYHDEIKLLSVYFILGGENISVSGIVQNLSVRQINLIVLATV